MLLALSDTARTLIAVLGTAGLVATACALVGTFLVMRRMALIGDAISHAILPGIAIGFILTRSLQSWALLIGAAAAGLVTVWLVETLYRTRRLHEDSAIAAVFPALFALGVLLVSRLRYVHLDERCIVYGSIENAEFDALRLPLLMAVLNLFFVLTFYKVLKVCTFDPEMGQALGFSPTLVHYLLMSAVSLTTVACFEAVGAILVVALLVVPPATAYLLADRLWLVLVLAVAFGLLAAGTGYVVASEQVLDSSVSGAMAAMAGFWFVVAWLVAPRHGLLAALWRRRLLRRRFMASLLLAHLRKVGPVPSADPAAAVPAGWHGPSVHRLLADLDRQGLVSLQEGWLALTPAGTAVLKEGEDLGWAERVEAHP